MAFADVLKTYQPVANEDASGFDILKGTYRCALDLKLSETTSEPKRACYKMELAITDVLEGNGSAGRKFWRTYIKDEDRSMQKMLNDLFTMGVSLPTMSVEDFEVGMQAVQGTPVTVRAWGWTPEKDRDGAPIPADKREAQQQFKIVDAKAVKVKASADAPPF